MLSNKGLYKSMQYVQYMLVVAVNFNLFQILWGLLLKLPFLYTLDWTNTVWEEQEEL